MEHWPHSPNKLAGRKRDVVTSTRPVADRKCPGGMVINEGTFQTDNRKLNLKLGSFEAIMQSCENMYMCLHLKIKSKNIVATDRKCSIEVYTIVTEDIYCMYT